MNILVTTVLMEMGHGVAMGTVFGTKENVNQNQSIKLNQSKMILILKVIMYNLISVRLRILKAGVS